MAFLLSSVGCGTSSAPPLGETTAAITQGAADDTDTAAVLVIGKSNGKLIGLCSGVVISPHVVLTAAHCSSSDIDYSIFLGGDYNDSSSRALVSNEVKVAEHHAHPKWVQDSTVNDIGILITASPLPSTPAVINRTPLAKGDVGRSIRIVGYGRTSGKSTALGRRMSAQTTIAGLDATGFAVEGSPNICLYDSGGPTFASQNEQDVVVGIHSLVDSAECNSQGVDVRVDAYIDFVDGYIQQADPPMTDVGALPAEPEPTENVDATAAPPVAPASGCSTAAARSSGSDGAVSASLLAMVLIIRAAGRRRRGEARVRRSVRGSATAAGHLAK